MLNDGALIDAQTSIYTEETAVCLHAECILFIQAIGTDRSSSQTVTTRVYVVYSYPSVVSIIHTRLDVSFAH